jgi:allantoinase
MTVDKVFRGRRVVVDHAVRAASIHVARGKIAAVAGYDELPPGVPIVDAGDDVILPGLVDTHVHMNEPGRTAWEGFATATWAAAAGGITSLVDMPLNSLPPTTTTHGLVEKRKHTEGQLAIDVGFWGGVVPGNALELAPLVEEGVLGFKCFLIDSGVPEFPPVDESQLLRALDELRALHVPLLVHAELAGPIDAVARTLPSRGLDKRSYQYHLESRPKAAEDEAIELVARLCRSYRSPMHIVHHSSSTSLSLLEAARAEGLPLTAETCPHYLSFAAEDIPDGATWFKCTPPIRERENREQLWEALKRGVLDSVVSDHSPCTPDLKRTEAGDFDAAWGGVASLQLTLPVTWTEARARGCSIVDVVRWMAERPAALAGISGQKGRIAKGLDADFAFFDLEGGFVVDGSTLHHRHKLTPYAGRALFGVVRSTWLRGERVFERDHDGPPPRRGELLARV